MKNIFLIILIIFLIFSLNKIYILLTKDTFQTIDPPKKDEDIETETIQNIDNPSENQLKELLNYRDLQNSSNAIIILNLFNSSKNMTDFIKKLNQQKKLSNLGNKIQLLYNNLSSLTEEGIREDKLTDAGRYRISAYLIEEIIKEKMDKKIKDESSDDIILPLKSYNLIITQKNILSIIEKMYNLNNDSLIEKYV